MPIVDPKVEEPARRMLGHAIHGEGAELEAAIRAAGGERYRQAPTSQQGALTVPVVSVDYRGGENWPRISAGRTKRSVAQPSDRWAGSDRKEFGTLKTISATIRSWHTKRPYERHRTEGFEFPPTLAFWGSAGSAVGLSSLCAIGRTRSTRSPYGNSDDVSVGTEEVVAVAQVAAVVPVDN